MRAILRDAAGVARTSQPPLPPNAQPPGHSSAEYAKHLYQLRRKREAVFGDVFGEPAWDMMLDLFTRQAQHALTSTTSLCIAGCVPSTTGLRWIERLIESGILVRDDDPFDRRRSFISLSPVAFDAMNNLLQTAMGLDPRLVSTTGDGSALL